jgi:hypothetical protein
MRARVRRKKTWYYYDCGGKPRKEIPLGQDYVIAVQKWSELELKGRDTVARITTFPALWEKYEREVLHTLKSGTIRTHKSDIKHLLRFFGEPPAPIEQVKPKHIFQFLEWLKDKPTTANRCKRLFSKFVESRARLGLDGFAKPLRRHQGSRHWLTRRLHRRRRLPSGLGMCRSARSRRHGPCLPDRPAAI